MVSVSEALRTAVGLHQGNRLKEAADLYRKILKADPSVADAWHLLGVLHQQTGDPARAVELIGSAIARDPACAAYHDNLGAAWRAKGDVGRAAFHHRHAVTLDPAWAKALGNLGGALLDTKQAEGGIAALRRAVRLVPGQDAARLRLGDALLGQGRAAEAEAVYAGLEGGRPTQPAHLYRLGVSKLSASGLLTAHPGNSRDTVDAGRMRDAIACFVEAARGGHAEALKNSFGTTILALQNGVLDDATLAAVARFARQVLKAMPRHTAALAVVCYHLYRQNRMELACRFFRKHARHFTAAEIAGDFELLVWSAVRGDRRFFERLSGYQPRRFASAARRTLAPCAENGGPILLVGCDEGYWRRFGAGFLASFRGTAASCRLHLHVVNPSPETEAELIHLCEEASGRLSASVESIDLSDLAPPVRTTYYACARFAVTRELIRAGRGPVLQLDIDSRFLEDPGVALASWPDWDIALMEDRRRRGPTRDLLAGFLAINRTEAAAAFLDRVVAYIGWHFDEGRAYWGVDQAAPYCVLDWLTRSGSAPSAIRFDFETFPFLEFLAK